MGVEETKNCRYSLAFGEGRGFRLFHTPSLLEGGVGRFFCFVLVLLGLGRYAILSYPMLANHPSRNLR